MTTQITETLYIRGEKTHLLEEPLESCDLSLPVPISDLLHTDAMSVALHRGYQGTWLIHDAKLYLIAFDVLVDDHEKLVPMLDRILPENCDTLRASWYSGSLTVSEDPLPLFGQLSGLRFEVSEGIVTGLIDLSAGDQLIPYSAYPSASI